jgi:hypothetical protein
MNTLEEVRQMCHVDEGGHWIWRGAMSGGRPNVKAPDYTKNEGRNKSQRGARAVWHLKNKKPVPEGHRVFVSCGERGCINPAHVKCECVREWGKKVAESGVWKNDPRKIIANRAKNMRRSKVTVETMQIILSSPKTGRQLAKDLGLSHNVVSRIRLGQFVSLAAGNPFAGLGA